MNTKRTKVTKNKAKYEEMTHPISNGANLLGHPSIILCIQANGSQGVILVRIESCRYYNYPGSKRLQCGEYFLGVRLAERFRTLSGTHADVHDIPSHPLDAVIPGTWIKFRSLCVCVRACVKGCVPGVYVWLTHSLID